MVGLQEDALHQQGIPADPTIVDPVQRAQIENYIGVSLSDADPAAIKFVVDQSKVAGKQAFIQKKYNGMHSLYTS